MGLIGACTWTKEKMLTLQGPGQGRSGERCKSACYVRAGTPSVTPGLGTCSMLENIVESMKVKGQVRDWRPLEKEGTLRTEGGMQRDLTGWMVASGVLNPFLG